MGFKFYRIMREIRVGAYILMMDDCGFPSCLEAIVILGKCFFCDIDIRSEDAPIM